MKVGQCLYAAAAGSALVCVILAYFFLSRGRASTLQLRAASAVHGLSSVLATQPANAADSSGHDRILDLVAVPVALRGKTPWEQASFVRAALKDELSDKGMNILMRIGMSGPLAQVFPAEAETWARQAGVTTSECIAFRAETNGVRAELVIATNGFKFVRCNDIRRLEQTGL